MFLDLDSLKIDNLSDNELDDSGMSEESEIEYQDLKEEPKMVEFTLRIPQKIDKFIRDFEQLKAKETDQYASAFKGAGAQLNGGFSSKLAKIDNANLSVMGSSVVGEVAIERGISTENKQANGMNDTSPLIANSNTSKPLSGSAGGGRLISENSGESAGKMSTKITESKSKSAGSGGVKFNFAERFNRTKNNVESYINALQVIASKVVRSQGNKIFRIKGYLMTDHYGPDNDVIKYLKIKDIVLKQQNENFAMNQSTDRFGRSDSGVGVEDSPAIKSRDAKTIKASRFRPAGGGNILYIFMVTDDGILTVGEKNWK